MYEYWVLMFLLELVTREGGDVTGILSYTILEPTRSLWKLVEPWENFLRSFLLRNCLRNVLRIV
jgi:hypothetical protein